MKINTVDDFIKVFFNEIDGHKEVGSENITLIDQDKNKYKVKDVSLKIEGIIIKIKKVKGEL